ncbi:hypothetical protein ACRAWG_10205 [Methylobacterium sp. P31]
MDRLRAIPATVEAIERQERARLWHAYQEATRASTAYGGQPLPTPEEHAATMEALRAGADAALDEYGRNDGFREDGDW